MKKHDESRRAFIVGAAVGAGAVAGGALIAASLPGSNDEAAAPAGDHMHGDGGTLGAFLNAAEGATIAAFAERLMPGAPGKPGATEAGVRNYIDLALAGAYSSQQDFYRRGIRQLDAYSNEKFGTSFVVLTPAQQDETITALEEGTATGFVFPSAKDFFEVLRMHTMEGMFADPIYGGNKGFAGWRLVGFPGAQPSFSPVELASKDAFTGPSVIGINASVPRRA